MACITLAVLVLQIALTRIMSSTFSHHSAFIVLAVVMLGLAASAIAAYRDMVHEEASATRARIVKAARQAAVATALAPIILSYAASLTSGLQYRGFNIVLAAGLFYFGFFYSGYVVAGLLTHFAFAVSRLYWFDLLGAALGCLVVVPLLDAMSAFSVVLLCSGAIALASTILVSALRERREQYAGVALVLALLALWFIGLTYPWVTPPVYRSSNAEQLLIWEGWTSLARVSVFSEVPGLEEAVQEHKRATPRENFDTESVKRRWAAGWGTSKSYYGEVAPLLWMELDSGAGTQIVGNAKSIAGHLDFLKWDVTAAAYWLVPSQRERVFIAGGGGGRDVLTANLFGFASIDVVELNPLVVQAVQEKFGHFSGKPYSLPNVNLSIGEARNNLSRRSREYDLIQLSMVDTFAASVAGSLVLTEQSLYTIEAFELFIKRLKTNGMLSISRWYNIEHFAELGRTLRLMAAALRRQGVDRPEDHIAVVYNQGYLEASVVNCILKKTPWTQSDLQALRELHERMKFTVLWPEIDNVTQRESLDIAGLMAADLQTQSTLGFDFSPPTDDRPFFFSYRHPVKSLLEAIRTRDLTRVSPLTIILGEIVLFLLLLTTLIVMRLRRYESYIPLHERVSLRDNWRTILYFTGIGLGFMFIELGSIQRYILFLGHPTYAITLVLFTLLLFSGIGSWLTHSIPSGSCLGAVRWALTGVLVWTFGTAFLVPEILHMTYSWTTASRFMIAASLIAPVATCMGMIFPLGARTLSESRHERLIPYMWGVNGIASVFASVLGMGIAVSYGYTTVFVLAILSYALTLFAVGLRQEVLCDT